MKLTPENEPQDNKVIAAEHRQVRPNKYVASMNPHPGHRIWEFDLATGEIAEAKIDATNVQILNKPAVPAGHVKIIGTGSTVLHKKVTKRPNCLYCSALNKKNALKKFIPMYARLKAGGHISQHIEPSKSNYTREDGEMVFIDWEVGGEVDIHDSGCVDVWLTGEDQQGRKYTADGNMQDDELEEVTNVEEVTNG